MMPLILFIFLIVPALPASATDELFRCDDGTFTNRAELLCTPYESHGTVMVAPEGTRPAHFAPFFEQGRLSPACCRNQTGGSRGHTGYL
jgi:hypothetical protein